MLEYRILGPLEVAHDGRLAELGPPKQRALLAVLLLNANEIVPVDRLIDLLWPDHPPRHAVHSIQVYVSELRRALEPLGARDAINWRTPGYVLAAGPGQIDSHLAEGLVSEGAQQLEAGDWAAAGVTLRCARQLWRGAPLSDFVYEEFAQDAIRHLTGVWLSGTEALAEVELNAGAAAQAVSLAEAALREDPLRERPRELQIRALYRLGRAAEALRAYEAYRRSLADELGVEPSADLQRLHEATLIHDPALGAEEDHAPVRSPAPARNPYKGLRAFGEADARDFFGRETLLRRILDALAAGIRLVTIVGPSGAGKSSVLAAGLIPALRSDAVPGSVSWAINQFRPGPHPLAALHAALRGQPDVDTELILVIDQFEEAFDLADTGECDSFLDLLTTELTRPGGNLRAVLGLRADFYDRPLLHAPFAATFVPGVVNVVPMAASELEAAIVEPARQVGIAVDPALLAELVSETVGQPGVLPLLQHTLAEMFERRDGDVLHLADYERLGGLRGALSRRAEDVFGGLDARGQAAARQILLRLVRLGDAHAATARRVAVRELAELGLDPVVLSDVVRRLESARLLTFGRDPASDTATVEVAHEALLSSWDRLAGWIEAARSDLHRRAALSTRVVEWFVSGRAPEDLLTGARLDDYDAWARETTLALTSAESAFIEASREKRRAEQAEAVARTQRERRLERRARTGLIGLAGASALLIGAVGFAMFAWPGPAPDVVLVYPGPGDGGMYDAIKSGFDGTVATLALDAQTVTEQPNALRSRLARLADQGAGLIVVGYAWSYPEVELVARDHTATRFLATDYHGQLANVAVPRFALQEGAFLVGAAAALKSATGTVAIIVDEDSNREWAYAAGFVAGAKQVNPDGEVLTRYLTEPPGYGAVTFPDVNQAAHELYRIGADVIFYSGRSAPLGLFEAASSESNGQGRQLWAIAMDSDWYVALPWAASREARDAAEWRPHVLTSLITRYDLAVSSMLSEITTNGFDAGERRFGLAEGIFELSTSGGFVADDEPTIADLRDRIISGQIVVPEIPDDRSRHAEGTLSGR